MRTGTYTHVSMQTIQAHKHTQRHTHLCDLTCGVQRTTRSTQGHYKLIHIHMDTCRNTYYIRTPAHTHTHTHMRKYANKTSTQTHLNTQTHTHTHIRTHTHTHTHIRTHTHTHTYVQTHKRTHTHSHSYLYLYSHRCQPFYEERFLCARHHHLRLGPVRVCRMCVCARVCVSVCVCVCVCV
jgi:hypothetical protein